jgi:hypothetical protein
MKLKNGRYIVFILIIVVLMGCNNGKEIITTSPSVIVSGPESGEIVTPTQTVAPTLSPNPVSTIENLETPEPSIKPAKELQPNEFNAKDIKIGDNIVGLKVSTIERDTIEPDSLVIHFEGDLQLKGTFEYYTKEQLGQEN